MKKYFIFPVLFITLFICSKVIAQDAPADTLNGTVDEHEIDGDGNILSIIFSTLDEDFNHLSYIIVNNETGMKLIDFVGQNIDVIGTTKKNPDGTNSITVLEFFVPEDEDDANSDDLNIDSEE